MNRSAAATLQVFSMLFEPITSETNALGRTVNPSCVVVGRSGSFKATVSSNIADDEIVWNASSEEAGLVTSTGRMAEVIPTACGTYTLWVQVGDYERAKGTVTFQAEFLDGGDVIYRYNGIPANEVAVGVFRNGSALPVEISTNTTSVPLSYTGDSPCLRRLTQRAQSPQGRAKFSCAAPEVGVSR